ncbi:MAG: 30S ribosomal protein S1 [Pseudomonadota bacterium]
MDKDTTIPSSTNDDENFSELLEQSLSDAVRFEPGQKVEAVILNIGSEWIFLTLGRKGEGCLNRKEFLDADGNLTVREGDTIQAYFLSARENELLFTTKLTGETGGKDFLEEACRNAIPVEGLVEKEIKGGYEVKIAGNVRAFCPFSQMGLRRAAKEAEYIGKHLTFRIIEYAENGRKVVLSNRVILEEEHREKVEALKSSLQEGMTVNGTVTSIHDFGAFVNIGLIDGLLPVSEIGWGRVEDVGEKLSVGQQIQVVIKKLDWEKERFSFSLKDTLPDPWDDIENKYPLGSYHTGEIVRLMEFGAFVNLEGGVDGLIHISKLAKGRKIKHPREAVSRGQTIEVKIEAVDKENKRLSLSPAGAAEEEAAQDQSVDYRTYVKSQPKSMGTLGDLLKSRIAGAKKS